MHPHLQNSNALPDIDDAEASFAELEIAHGGHNSDDAWFVYKASNTTIWWDLMAGNDDFHQHNSCFYSF